MKKIYTIFTFIIAVCLIGSHSVEAQTQVDVVKNDSLIIELAGYKQGGISWQRSSNGTSWSTVSAFKDKAELAYKMTTTPYYFRSVIADGTCDPVYSDTIQANLVESFSAKGGHGYVESAPNVAGSGISMAENGILSNWSDKNSSAVWFIYQKAGTYKVSFNMKGTNGREYKLKMNVSAPDSGIDYAGESFPFTYSGSGSTGTYSAFTITIPQAGYYRYELNSESATMSGITINELKFEAVRMPGEPSLDSYAASRLNATSLHLSFSSTANTTKNYDWIYEEILVPEGYDPTITYWMSLGFFGGYMGIQANSEIERRVLFSAWDIVDTDKWPDAPKEALVSLVDKAPYTQANTFGAEGTGGQSYVGAGNVNTWKTGKPVKFLMNSRRAGGIIADKTISGVVNKGDSIRHSVVSAWYDAGEGWKYIASWRMPRKLSDKTMFDGFYSFIENYDKHNGQIDRKGYYYNAFAKEQSTGKWVNLNKVGFSTDGNKRTDYGHGIDNIHPDKFYMQTGGYGKNTTVGTSATLPLLNPDDIPAIKELNIDEFTARVNQALEREEYLKNLEYLSKTGWSVVGFSSQEPNENGGLYGAARFIIDGDDNSYWHSKWTGGGSSFPHWFIVDMAETQKINGFRLVPSGGSGRNPKDIKIEVSNDPNGTWTEIWSGTASLSPDLIELDAPVSGYRYFKLSILNGYSDGVHTRLKEIYVF